MGRSVDSRMLAKLVGGACSIGVLCALKSGLLASGVLLFVALPLAVWCRRKMTEEASEPERFLAEHNALGAMYCTCFEGAGDLRKNTECLVCLTEDEIVITWQGGEMRLPYGQLASAAMYTPLQLLHMAKEPEGEMAVGRLSQAFCGGGEMDSADFGRDQMVRYLVLRGKDEQAFRLLSFYSRADQYSRNQAYGATEELMENVAERIRSVNGGEKA